MGDLRSYYLYVLTRFLFNTALRINECTQLQWKSFERYNDQDGNWRWRCYFIPKGGQNLVSQKVPERCVALIRRLWRRRFGRNPQPEEFVWFAPPSRITGETKSARLTNVMAWTMYAYELTELVNVSGLFEFKVYFHPHYWRHSCANFLRAEMGYDPREVQLVLRHKSLDTTVSTYFHDSPKDPEEYAI
jgi:integrase